VIPTAAADGRQVMAGFEKEFANDGHQQQLAKHAKEAIPELFAAHAEDNPDHSGERVA
jgi:hypothetical protein